MCRSLVTVLSFLIVFSTTESASKPQQPGASSDAELVTITASVRDKKGGFVMGVPREYFSVVDGKTSRPIEDLQNADPPISLGLLVDTSYSMQQAQIKDRTASVGSALARFIDLGHRDNEYFVVAFDKESRLLMDWQSGPALRASGIHAVKADRSTAFYDACFSAFEKLKTAKNARRALLIFSDGQDNASKHTFKELRDQLRDSDILFYAIGISFGADIGSSLGLEGASILKELAELTGGTAVFPIDGKELTAALELLAVEMRHQYRLAFRVPKSEPGTWREIKLRVTAPKDVAAFNDLKVKTRRGYVTH